MRLTELPLCDDAASPNNCAADGSGGLDGSACELRVVLLGVAEADFCCLLFDGDDIVTIDVVFISSSLSREVGVVWRVCK